MVTHKVLSSPSKMRLGPPGAPSLIDTGLPAVLLVRFRTVRLPVNRPSDKSCWPTTYMVEPATNALLEPPGTGIVVIVPVTGSWPDCWPVRKIMGATGIRETEEAVPPH